MPPLSVSRSLSLSRSLFSLPLTRLTASLDLSVQSRPLTLTLSDSLSSPRHLLSPHGPRPPSPHRPHARRSPVAGLRRLLFLQHSRRLELPPLLCYVQIFLLFDLVLSELQALPDSGRSYVETLISQQHFANQSPKFANPRSVKPLIMADSLEVGAKSRKFAIRNCNQNPTAETSGSSFISGAPISKRGHFCTGAEIDRFRQLPEEVVEEILLRLPSDSLKNCKHVCKWWFKLINDPSFVNKHLVRITSKSSKLPRSIFLKWIRQELSEEDIFSPYPTRHIHANDPTKLEFALLTIDDDDGNGDHLPCVIDRVHLPPVPEGAEEDFPTDFCAIHCNGIIHMFDHWNNWVAILLNPALKEFRLLQSPELPHSSSNFDSVIGCGFGYDPQANVYKYVKIFGNDVNENPRALVHTLGTNSWRKIKIDVKDNYCFLYPNGLYFNGAYYWWNVARTEDMILSFNMLEEKFYSMPFPKVNQQRKMFYRTLGLWNDSVVLFFCTKYSWFSMSLEMWGMVDNIGGVGKSNHWVKHLKIGPLSNVNCPLAFWKNDELLMETRDGRIVSYNLYTRKFRKVTIPGAVYPGLTYACLCLKSLISVE